ncbi:MAG TPA: hypothetical protein ENK51_05095 [Gammaproteobacteria bacterium]|nr:hypothetical protein [Gammaproteobacteria bacterium]
MPTHRHPHSLPGRQHGAALVAGLLIMIVMTFIGITAMESSITQSSLATNAQLKAIGFQSTEAALTRAASDPDLLERALDAGFGEDTKTESEGYSSFQAVLDIQKGDDGAKERLSTPVTTDIEVAPLGKTTVCSNATEINANASETVSTPDCIVFELVANTSIGDGAQVRTRHTQHSDRLMPAQPGGTPWY